MKKLFLGFVLLLSALSFAQQVDFKGGIFRAYLLSLRNFAPIIGEKFQEINNTKLYKTTHKIGDYGNAYIVESGNGERWWVQTLKLSDVPKSTEFSSGVIEALNKFKTNNTFTMKEYSTNGQSITEMYNSLGKKVLSFSTSPKQNQVELDVYVHSILKGKLL